MINAAFLQYLQHIFFLCFSSNLIFESDFRGFEQIRGFERHDTTKKMTWER